MFIRFVLENFLSFREETEFNMLVGNFKVHKQHVYSGTIDTLRAAAIYGANGAGKSNIIKGIEFLQEIVKNDGLILSVNNYKFKLDKENKDKAISFEIELLLDNRIYAYGVNLDNNIVLNEWLFENSITKKDKMIFERSTSKKGITKIKLDKQYNKTKKQQLLVELMEENLLKSNELFLCKDVELKLDVISNFKDAILNNIVVIHPQSKYKNLTPHISLSEEFKGFANSLLKTFDTGVNELKVEKIEFDKFFGEDDEELKEEIILDLEDNEAVLIYHKGKDLLISKEEDKFYVEKLVSNHLDKDGNNISFEIEDESDGTQRLLDFIPAFNGILNNDITFIIDEIDQSLHPALLKSLVSKIMSEENTKGQLIFTTHESNLLDLDIFRQDEIWFVEKNKSIGSSNIYSLSEFKPRYDLDIRKGYLKGRFGAIPFLANLEDLNWSDYES